MKRCACLVLIVILASCRSKQEIPFEIVEASPQDLVQWIEANGSVEALSTIDVFAPVPGRIERIFVKEGDNVRARQQLGFISSESRTLFLDMASTKSKEELEYWKNQIQLTPIVAPTSGKIISLKAALDSKVAGAIAQISKGEVIRANVDEADLTSIKTDRAALIRFDIAPGIKLAGKIEKTAQTSRLVNNVNVYQVEVGLPSAAELKKLPFAVKLGMSVTLSFMVDEKKQALALPVSAVDGRSGSTVKMVLEDGRKTKVKLGGVYGKWVEVVSGLQPGDKVKIPKFNLSLQKTRKSPLMLKKD